jgi:hypothetical protein
MGGGGSGGLQPHFKPDSWGHLIVQALRDGSSDGLTPTEVVLAIAQTGKSLGRVGTGHSLARVGTHSRFLPGARLVMDLDRMAVVSWS